MNNENYSIGVDIGVASVGFAVTNDYGEMLKIKGYNMWGTRLFDEGKPALSTRMFRSNRRRLSRRKQRIKWLQNLVSEDVLAVDDCFFQRIQESDLYPEDKTNNYLYTFFDDKEFNEKEYYKKYPTIYHLRKHLIESNKKEDIRLIYLALHHIIKYRGNFLYEGQNIYSGIKLSESISNILKSIPQCKDWEKKRIDKVSQAVEKKIKEKEITVIEKRKEIEKILSFDKSDKSAATNIAAILVGSKADLKKIFLLETDDESKVSLSDEDVFEKASSMLDENQLECFENMQKVYSSTVLSEIIDTDKENISISIAMVDKYNRHQSDLKILKRLYKKYLPEKYKGMFSSNKQSKISYENYIHHSSICNYDDLKKEITKDLSDIDDKNAKYVLKQLELSQFINKLNTKDNGAIPYQLHEQELVKILDNQSVYYNSIKENKDKIISILQFKIPYYVGPLSTYKTRFSWMERKFDDMIYPWNFDEVVDKDKSAEKFIERMRNSCTYLPENDVIPKNSLLYSEFEVRNEIKQIRLDNYFMSNSMQNDLYEELFKTQKTIKENTFRMWLKQKGLNPEKITGYQKDKEFATSLKAYIDFKSIFGKVDDSNKEMIEKIIHWITIFKEKDIIKKKINVEFPKITESQCKKILNLKYTGWSRLSRELLTELKTVDNHGNYKSIMDYMRSSKKNFMQIINDKNIGFYKLIEENNQYSKTDLTLETIQNLYTSPANKKAIWQTILVIKEIEKIMGRKPTNIFVEFARSDEKSKRTTSRYYQLDKKYKAISDNKEYKEVAEYLAKFEKNQKAIDDRVLYLYFIQNGKCMYTGETLDINKLYGDYYEVDHIIPRSYIKDDSFDNLALVVRSENQRKGDSLLLSEEIRNSQRNRWIKLKNDGLITSKKFNNLMRDKFVDEDLQRFISRQLVETRQITKHVVNLLQNYYEGTNIVSIKASMTANIRQKYDFAKIRDLNDYHHAFDALIVCVVGCYIKKCYPSLDEEFNYGEYRKFVKNNKHNQKNYGYLLESLENIKVDSRTGEIIWNGKNIVECLLKAYGYKDCFISRKTEELTGEFYNQTLQPKSNTATLVPKKQNLPVSKYGGYNNVNQAYYIVIEYDGKNGRKKEIIGIPIQIAQLEKTKIGSIEKFISQSGKTNIKILKDKIRKYQKIVYEGSELYIVSDSEVINAKQLILSVEDMRIMAKVFDNIDVDIDKVNRLIIHIIEKINKYYPCFNNIYIKLNENIDEILSLNKNDKVNFIRQLLKVTRAKSTRADLSVFVKGLPSSAGRMSKKHLDVDKVEFIDNSVTGIFTNKTKVK